MKGAHPSFRFDDLRSQTELIVHNIKAFLEQDGHSQHSTDFWYYEQMNSKQRKTWKAIFADPVRNNIAWPDVINLIKGLGGAVIQGSGSRVRIDLNDIALNIHSPHPGNELKRYQVKAVRDFLIKAGIDHEI